MKKILLLSAVACVTMTMTSCKKDYTCTCKDNSTTNPDPDQVVKYTKVKKKDAQASCDLLNTFWAGDMTCTLN